MVSRCNDLETVILPWSLYTLWPLTPILMAKWLGAYCFRSVHLSLHLPANLCFGCIFVRYKGQCLLCFFPSTFCGQSIGCHSISTVTVLWTWPCMIVGGWGAWGFMNTCLCTLSCHMAVMPRMVPVETILSVTCKWVREIEACYMYAVLVPGCTYLLIRNT